MSSPRHHGEESADEMKMQWAAGEWLCAAQELGSSIELTSQWIQARAGNATDGVSGQAVLDAVGRGTARASQLIEQFSRGRSEGANRPGASNPLLVQLAQRFVAGFQSVGVVCVLVEEDQTEGVRSQILHVLSLAQRAATAVRQATEMVFERQGLGTVDNFHQHVSKLEYQADAVFQQALISLDSQHSSEIRILTALDSLMDRCEDIAETLSRVQSLMKSAES